MRDFNFRDIYQTNKKISSEHLYCFEGQVDIPTFCRDYEADTGFKLMAESPNDVVNGAVISTYSPKGIKSKTWCEAEIDEDHDHTCIIVFLYGENFIPPKIGGANVLESEVRKAEKIKISKKSMTMRARDELDSKLQQKGFTLKARKD